MPKSIVQQIQDLLKLGDQVDRKALRKLIKKDPDAAMFVILQQAGVVPQNQSYKPDLSTPSGMIPPYEKENKKGSNKKPGPKKGHSGKRRKKKDIDQKKSHRLDRCPICGGELQRCNGAGSQRTRLTEDMPSALHSETTEHTIYRDYCPHCMKHVEPKVADALPKTIIGNRLVALTAYWHYLLGLTGAQIRETLQNHLQFDITEGGLFGLWHRLAGILQTWYDELQKTALQSAVLHADETGWRVNGKTQWLWCFTNADTTLYMIHPSRGDPALFEFFKENFTGVLVSDFWACYSHIDTTHQYCLVHLLRELKKVDAANTSLDWIAFSKKAKRLFGDALRLYHRDGYDPSLFQSKIERFNKRLIDLMLTSSEDKDVKRIAKRLENYWDELLVFLDRPDVPPTNNHAEREIRPAVIMRKVSHGNASNRGAHTQAVLMSIFRTMKRRGLNVTEIVEQALRNYILTESLPPFPQKSPSDE